MNVELKRDQMRAIMIAEQLEKILADLDSIDAKIPAVHVDVALTSLCENYKIPRSE